MLSHRYRFHGHGSLRYLYKNSRTARTRSLMLRYTPNKNRVHARFAVIVSKKVLKSSAKRNRVRRRIYEIIRLHQEEIPNSHDYAVTVFSPEMLTMPAQAVEREVVDLFKQVRLPDIVKAD